MLQYRVDLHGHLNLLKLRVGVCGKRQNEQTMAFGSSAAASLSISSRFFRHLMESSCPCSAALARQLIQQAFKNKFDQDAPANLDDIHAWLGTTEGIVATPHSQRSVAEVKVKLNEACNNFPIKELVDAIEDTLKTPVQAAVKREDEQEFARLNGQNLMFCEDSARRLQHMMNLSTQYDDFWLRINHLESLHAHDAVSVTTKGIDGGYQA